MAVYELSGEHLDDTLIVKALTVTDVKSAISGSQGVEFNQILESSVSRSAIDYTLPRDYQALRERLDLG